MKNVFIISAVIIALFIMLSLFKDIIIKASVENGVELITGLPLKIQSFRAGIINTTVAIKGLMLYNPKGYKDKIMLDMPQVYVDYNLPEMLKGKVHLKQARMDLKEFLVVKNENGELNLDSLKVVKARKEGKDPEEKEKGPPIGKAGKAPQLQIDELELKIGKVIYKDYSKGAPPTVNEYNVNINERYTNITNPHALVSLIIAKVLMNTAIDKLINLDLETLQQTAFGAAEKAQEALKQTTQKAQEAAKATTETLKKTAEELKEVFKLPLFGAKEDQQQKQ